MSISPPLFSKSNFNRVIALPRFMTSYNGEHPGMKEANYNNKNANKKLAFVCAGHIDDSSVKKLCKESDVLKKKVGSIFDEVKNDLLDLSKSNPQSKNIYQDYLTKISSEPNTENKKISIAYRLKKEWEPIDSKSATFLGAFVGKGPGAIATALLAEKFNRSALRGGVVGYLAGAAVGAGIGYAYSRYSQYVQNTAETILPNIEDTRERSINELGAWTLNQAHGNIKSNPLAVVDFD